MVIIFSIVLLMPLIACFYFGDKFSVGSPTALIFLIEFIGVSLKSIYLVYSSAGGVYLDELVIENMAVGLILIFLFNLSYAMGFFIIKNRILFYFYFRRNKRVQNCINFLILAIGLSLMAQFFIELDILGSILVGNFSAKRFIYVNGQEMALGHLRIGADILLIFSLVCLVKGVRNNDSSQKVLAFLILVFVVLYHVVVSSRLGVLLVFFSVYVIYSNRVEVNSNKIKVWVKVPLFLCLASVVIIFVTGSRSANTADSVDINSASSAVIDQAFSGTYGLTIDKAALAVAKVPDEFDYRMGATLLSPFYFFVPRIIWESKPPVRFGPLFAEQIFEYRNESGIPPSLPVEAYWNFGWFGVLVFGFLFGVFVKQVLVNNNFGKADAIAIIVLQVFLVFPMMAGDFAQGAVSWMTAQMILYALGWNRAEIERNDR